MPSTKPEVHNLGDKPTKVKWPILCHSFPLSNLLSDRTSRPLEHASSKRSLQKAHPFGCLTQHQIIPCANSIWSSKSKIAPAISSGQRWSFGIWITTIQSKQLPKMSGINMPTQSTISKPTDQNAKRWLSKQYINLLSPLNTFLSAPLFFNQINALRKNYNWLFTNQYQHLDVDGKLQVEPNR